MNLREFLETLRARMRLALTVLLVGLLVTIGVASGISPTYGSNVKIFVSSPSSSLNERLVSLFIGQRVASYADLASNPVLLQRVSDQLSLDTSAPELEEQIQASVVEETQTIRIDATAESPELARDIAGAEAEQLARVMKRLDRSDEGERVVQARVLGEPEYNEDPLSPDTPLILVIGALLSIFLAVVAALVRAVLDRTVTSLEEVEDITGRSGTTTLPYDPEAGSDPFDDDRTGQLSEAVRVLRTNLQLTIDVQHRALLVSSPVRGDGKTLVATTLAVALAREGRSVLVVDADLRAPQVAARLGLDNDRGLTTVLREESDLEEVIQHHDSGVSLLAAGPEPPDPAELLGSRSLQQLLAVVRQEFDTVVVDAPPILPVADAAMLASAVDGVMLVARHGATTQEQLRQAVLRVGAVGGTLVDTVLNGTPRSGAPYGYGYGPERTPKDLLHLAAQVRGNR